MGPLLLVVVGMSGVLGLGALFSRYHWWFVGGAALLLGWAWRMYFKERAQCEDQHCEMKGKQQAKITLTIATVLVASFAALNGYTYLRAGTASLPPSSQSPLNLARLTLPVEGMTCLTCELTVRTALKKVPGVADASASVAGKSVTVEYDPLQVTVSQLKERIRQSGYRVPDSKSSVGGE